MIRRLPVFSVAAATLVALSAAQQQSIYVDIGSPTTGFGTPSNTFAAAAPNPGEWNSLDMDAAAGLDNYTSPPLVDTAGAVTAVTLTWDAPGLFLGSVNFDEPSTMGDDALLMDDIGWANGLSEIRFEGLGSGVYDVFTYAMAPDLPTAFTSVNVIGATQMIQDVGGDFSAGYVLGTTHAFHTVAVSAGQTLVIEINASIDFDSINGIQVMPTGGGTGLGSNYCGPAVINSAGLSARMVASGSRVAADNDLSLSCLDMPNNSFGFFIASPAQGFVPNPGGSSGNLCLSGAVGRYVGPGQIQNSGSLGEIMLTLDLTMTPSPTGFVSVQSGETWNWQAWYRDSSGGMATSNFSDGLEIDFL